MPVDSILLAEIVRRILSVANPLRIILFGSAASGSLGPDSDIDLLILEENPTEIRQEQFRIRQALRGLGFPFDVIVMAFERFEETRNVIGGIAWPASKTGKVIYENR